MSAPALTLATIRGAAGVQRLVRQPLSMHARSTAAVVLIPTRAVHTLTGVMDRTRRRKTFGSRCGGSEGVVGVQTSTRSSRKRHARFSESPGRVCQSMRHGEQAVRERSENAAGNSGCVRAQCQSTECGSLALCRVHKASRVCAEGCGRGEAATASLLRRSALDSPANAREVRQ